MRSYLFRNFLLALPIMAFSTSVLAVYKVETASSDDNTAAEVTGGSPDTAEFWIKAQPAGDTNSLTTLSLLVNDGEVGDPNVAENTEDFTLGFPSTCEVEGADTDVISFSASSTGPNSYDLILGGSALTCGGGTFATPCDFYCVVTITPVDDMKDEDIEGINLKLAGPANNLKSPVFQIFTISDNDTAQLVVTDDDWNGSDAITLTQKSTSESGDQDSFWVELATEPEGNVTVNLVVDNTDEALISSGGADAGTLALNFTPSNWNDGQEVTITGQDDDPANPQDGNTGYSISVTADSAYDNLVGGPVTGLNIDNDEPGQLRFTQSSQNGNEGANLILQVERINGSSSAVTIDYTTSNGTASGSDYTDTTSSTTLSWDEGESGTRDITITLENDTLWEAAAEDFTVALQEGSITGGAVLLTPSSQTININPSDPIEIAISAPSLDPVPEGNDPDTTQVDFDVTYSGGTLESPMTIAWATVPGTATGDADYTTAGANIDLPVNGDAVTVSVTVLGDDLPEGNEVFSVDLSESFDLVTLAEGGSSTVTIEDDDASDAGTFSITDISPNPVMESEGMVTVTVSRIGNTVNTAATIDFATSDGTALDSSDYDANTGSLVWATDDEDEFKTFDVAINDDEAGEVDETFTVTISPDDAEVIGTASVNVTIIGDPTVTVNPSNYTVSEDGGSVTVFVERANKDDQAVSVDYTTTDGSATDGDDFTADSDTLTWTANELGAKSIIIPILADADEAGPETFTVDLSNCVNCTIANAQATVTIEEGEVSEVLAGTFDFSPTSVQVGEGVGNATMLVGRSGGSDGVVSVDWETVAGTADENDDFEPTTGTLTWADGSLGFLQVNVPIVDDDDVEPSESFTIRLIPGSVTGSEGDPEIGTNSTGTVTITDNDSEVPGEFSVIPTNVNESDGVINVSVTRDVGSTGDVSVTFTTVSGSATGENPANPATDDYLYTTGVLDWADGDSSAKTIPITIVDDAIAEPEEAFSVTLSNPQGGATINLGSSNVTIFDNDGGGDFSIDDVVVNENDQQATVTVTRANDNNSAASVFWETQDGTAQDENGSNDYTSASGELIWLDGDTSNTRTITIEVIADGITEIPETFVVAITGVQGESVTIGKSDGVVTIIDPIPIPTLSQWAMGLLTLLLLGLGVYSMPVRNKARVVRK